MIAAGDSIARIDRVFQNFRQTIDTDNSISPAVRDAPHALLDKDLVLARARILGHITNEEAQPTAMSIPTAVSGAEALAIAKKRFAAARAVIGANPDLLLEICDLPLEFRMRIMPQSGRHHPPPAPTLAQDRGDRSESSIPPPLDEDHISIQRFAETNHISPEAVPSRVRGAR
ncbi:MULTISPECIES: hypothetical protein [unclassified Bradyrhizobium]